MKLHEMDGFLKGKCLPGDMLVNETHAEYLVRKFAELQSALDVQSARSDALAAALKASEANDADARCHVAELEAKCAALAGENAALIGFDADEFSYNGPYQPDDAVLEKLKTPATDAWVNEQRAVGVDGAINVILTMMDRIAPAHHAISMLRAHAAQLRGSQV